ncbi:MAG: discoidin domain-containing protein [Pigmentiphaga sp.]|nr:discoidin domain-containing protein [Pigmentiphaga sp.]
MKTIYNKINISLLLIGMMVLFFACQDEFYTINQNFYKDKQIVVRNPLIKGDEIDTLRIELNNTEQIMLEELTDSSLVFDSKAFVYKVMYDSIAAVEEDGTIIPASRGTTPLDIIFRSDCELRTSVIIQVYKEYHAVEEIFVPDIASNAIVEIGEPVDLLPLLIVLPVNADNKGIKFYMEPNSEQYANITEEGVITGIKSTGRNKANIIVISDENPDIQAVFGVKVVDEIIITSVNVLAGLDGIEIGLGETIDLNLCTSVSPNTVNENNRKLNFELLEGSDVLSLNEAGIVRAIGIGTARLKAVSKNNLFKEFNIHVKTGLTDFTRLLWTITTSLDYGFVPDGTTGMAEDMFDNNNLTFFSITKPGKTYNDKHTPADHIPYFIVDMKSVQKFNYIRWNHRANNTYDYLRAWGVDLYGSIDGEEFSKIQEEINIPIESNTTTYRIDVPESEYRYVKVYITKWSDNSGGSTSGSTIQIAEFGLGYR